MTANLLNSELATLLADTREHLTYFHELGIEDIDVGTLPILPARTSAKTPAAIPRRPTAPAPIRSAPTVSRSEPLPHYIEVPNTSGPAVRAEKQSTETFAEIWAEIGTCTRCPLYQGRTNIVHTDGNQRARLMFVGEAPGADEDAQGRPFVGRAGQLLTKIIEAIGFRREEVLIGNVNRCRPPANRPPTPEEAAICKPFLLREIAAVRPEVIVVLGNTAMKNLLDTKIGITKLRGEFQEYQGAKVMPTFHPAYLLRDPSKKKETWSDLKKVRDYLDSTRKRSS